MKIITIIVVISCLLSCQNVQNKAFATVPDGGSIQQVLHDLVEYYETENALGFNRFVDENLRAFNDGKNNITLQRSIRDDFSLLDNIRFQIFVNSVQISADKQEVRVKLRWDRRAVILENSTLWILRNQISELVFKKQEGVEGTWKLLAMRDEVIFGLADISGKITIVAGEIDGVKVVAPIELRR